ncbi:hypothetical protein AK812_SmicGene5024 [Symbiodinium microadriaticum]|uniref:CS domain-containing protein n=1 Tax=Symbiodinium microadriaticum TaxID=2951 RepID=A0A1Q9EUT6_SYMMI|nr:hypothetical protein AK812_SmicGene5024 [Symbiodinium microadriaticum]
MAAGYGSTPEVPKALQPSVLWAQRKDSVFVTVDVKDAKDVSVQLEDDRSWKQRKDDVAYSFHLDLFAQIRREEPLKETQQADSDEEDEKGAFDTSGLEGMDFSNLSPEEVEGPKAQNDGAGGSDDRDSILADLDEDVAVFTDEEARLHCLMSRSETTEKGVNKSPVGSTG